MDTSQGPTGTEVFVGVDGGSSGLRAAIVDGGGRLIRRVDTKGIVPMLEPDAGDRLGETLDAVASAVPPQASVVGVYLALTGVDLPEDAAARVALEVGRSRWPESTLTVGNDGLAAWAGATGCLPGVAVMAGTGCVVVASDVRGQMVRAGGWGPLLGDAGGGWGIGVAALRAMLARHDIGTEPTRLDRRLLAALGAGSPLEIPGRVTGGRFMRSAVADLAQVVADEAESDAAAREVLDQAADALAVDTCHVIARLEWPSGTIPVVLTGNAFHRAYRSSFARALDRRVERATEIGAPVLSNEGGAALLALRESGRSLAAIVETLSGCADLRPRGDP